MNTIWIIFQILIGYNLILPVLLYICSEYKRSSSYEEAKTVVKQFDYAIIVTAYEQTCMLQCVVESLLRLNYNLYHIYIVADNCDISDLNISNPMVSVLRPESVLSSNTKSHFFAIDHFIRNHDILTIIDSDNTVDPEYINELNLHFYQGFNAVQGIRMAKNTDTTISCLDAARDQYYHFYDGEILFKLGSSSTLSGSGMAFKTDLYKGCLSGLEILGAGFDKVLQAQIVNNAFRIAYAPSAIVYDEKTSHSTQLINQRSRWINTWFKYFANGFKLISSGIINKNLNQFLFGLTLVRPPLFIFILLSLLFFTINLFVNPLHSIYWIFSFLVFVLGFFIALKKQGSSKKIYKSLASIPVFVFYQLISLYYLRVANKRSVATKHSRLD